MKIAEDIREVTHPEMPSAKEFFGAKLSDGLNALGNGFGRGARIARLRKDLLLAEGRLNRLASDIGKDVVEQVRKGNDSVLIRGEPIHDIAIAIAEIDRIKDEINR